MSWHTPTPDFGAIICVKLINLVKRHPILFGMTKERTLVPRKNRNETNRIWDEIAAEIGVPASDCKRRWKGLKDVYAKIRKRRLQEGLLGMQPRKKWIYEDSMSFLKFPFELDYRIALENFEEVDCKEWKMEDETTEEIPDEPNMDSLRTEEEQEEEEEEEDRDNGVVEYLDLDLEVDSVPDSEDYCSNESATKTERRISEPTDDKQEIQRSILKANNARSPETKQTPKYRPIRPKPYRTSFPDKIVNVSNLSPLNGYIMTGSTPRKGREHFGTVIVATPNMKLRSSNKSSSIAGSPGINKNDASPRKIPVADSATSGKSNADETNSKSSPMKKTGKGGIELFFESMAQTVMNLPLRAQAEIKMEICKIVTGAEIRYSPSQQSSSNVQLSSPSNAGNKKLGSTHL